MAQGLIAVTDAAWVHSLSPFALRVSGDFGLRWYGLSYVAAFLIGWVVLHALARRGRILIPAERVADAMMWIVAGTIVGGRLGYVLVYEPSLLWTVSSRPPWWGLLAVNLGGMASHGGMVGLVIAAWLISRGWREEDGRVVGRVPMLHVMDAMALVCPPGLLLGRLANFVNGELLGRVVAAPGEPGPWWSVRFPQELRGWTASPLEGGVPTGHAPDLSAAQQVALAQLVESVRLPGEAWNAGVDRLIAHAAEHREALAQVVSARHASQLYQGAAEGLVVGAVLWLLWMRPRKPGVVSAAFLVTYGVLRILTEFIRLPDAQFGAAGRIAGLSRGQWLSVVMIAAGLGVAWLAARRPGPRVGGWLGARA